MLEKTKRDRMQNIIQNPSEVGLDTFLALKTTDGQEESWNGDSE